MYEVRFIRTDTAAVTASSFDFPENFEVDISDVTHKGRYKLFALLSGADASDLLEKFKISAVKFPYTLSVDGNVVYITIEHDYTVLNGCVTSSTTLRDDEVIIGAGGFDIPTLSIPAGGKLTFDPVKTPIYVHKSTIECVKEKRLFGFWQSLSV